MANYVEGEWDWMNPQGKDVVLGSKRKQRFADILRKQATAPQGQMVGNIYVPPSILQHFASGINNYNANRLEREAGQDLEGSIKQRQEQMQTASQRLAEALRPKQVQQGETKLPFEPNQMNQFGTPMEGALQQTVPNMVERQPTPQELMMAQAQYAQDIGDPRLMQQAVGQQLNYNIGQQQREEERAFRSQEAQANREARMQEMAIKIQEGRATRQEQNEFRREMMQAQIDARRDMATMTAANRPQGAPVAVAGPDGKPVYVSPNQAIGRTPYNQKANAPLSATAQKELFEAEDIQQSSANAVGMLNEALDLNKKAYSGIGAKPRAVIASNLGFGEGGADATVNLDNLMTGQALESLKATFGGMPTEGERKILLEMQASADKTPKQREDILKRAIDIAKRRQQFNESKAKSLREGSYFNQPTQTQPQRVKRYNPATGRIE